MTLDINKKKAAIAAAEHIKDGMTIGLGSGSTVYHLLHELGSRVENGLKVQSVSSSKQTSSIAKDLNIPLIELGHETNLDLNIDGADEVNEHFQLIKGGGGALLREKVNAYFAKRNLIIVDESKVVSTLGKFPLPIEVTPYASKRLFQLIKSRYAIEVSLRLDGEGNPILTDNQNHIIDAFFVSIDDPEKLHNDLINLPGVVETGLFIGMCDLLFIGSEEGVIVKESSSS